MGKKKGNSTILPTLAEWPAVLNSTKWGPRLVYCDGTAERFFSKNFVNTEL